LTTSSIFGCVANLCIHGSRRWLLNLEFKKKKITRVRNTRDTIKDIQLISFLFI